MGFHISIESNAEQLLKVLRTSPGYLFERPYKGYLLFLAGAADQDTCDWLAENIVQLDSLTGNDIAYVLFARRLSVRMHTSHGERRPPRTLGHMSADELLGGNRWTIERLVKSGRWGWAADGDEIIAVTYAVDEIAKRWGILDKLPCVVVMDAIPKPDLNIIRLTPGVRSAFVDLLRRGLTKYCAQENYSHLERDTEHLLTAYREIQAASLRYEDLQTELRKLTSRLTAARYAFSTPAAAVEARLTDAKEALRIGSLRGFRLALTGSRRPSTATKLRGSGSSSPGPSLVEVVSEAERLHPTLHALTRTIKALSAADALTEPDRSSRLQLIRDKYVRKLLDESGSALLEAGRIGEVQDRLDHRLEELVSGIVALIPPHEALLSEREQIQIARHSEHIQQLETRVRMLQASCAELSLDPEAPVRAATARYDKAVEAYLKRIPPSFWVALSHGLRELRLLGYASKVRIQATELAAGIFHPDFLLKIWQAGSG